MAIGSSHGCFRYGRFRFRLGAKIDVTNRVGLAMKKLLTKSDNKKLFGVASGVGS
jgi:hypothetical protein